MNIQAEAASTISYRPLTRDDLTHAHKLSTLVAWPHRLEDWNFAFRLGEGEAVWSDGQLIGVAMRWLFSSSMTLGLIIVDKAYRGHRIGSTLVEHALQDIPDVPVLLHATLDGAGVYKRYGFSEVGAVKQYQGTVTDPERVSKRLSHTQTRAIQTNDWERIVELDEKATGMGRKHLLNQLLADPSASGVVLSEKDGIRGYACIRDFGRGRVIGPVVASNEDEAIELVQTLLASEERGFVRVDVPAQYVNLHQVLSNAGLHHVDNVTLMVRGTPLLVGQGYQFYALASHAYG